MGKYLLSYVFGLVIIATGSFSISARVQVGSPADALPNTLEPVAKAALVTAARPTQAPLAPERPGSVELKASAPLKPPSVPARAQLRRPSGDLLGPSEPIRVESLDAPDRPSPALVAPAGPQSVELEATKVPRSRPWILKRREEGMVVIAILLIFSLLGNAFQFYRQRFHGKTICNELVSTFNSVAWLLARCVNKTKELDERTTGERAGDLSLHKEFREFSLDTEFMLRALHEQLVAMARNFRRRDRSWRAGQFGYTLEEVQRIRRAISERPLENGGQALKSVSG